MTNVSLPAQLESYFSAADKHDWVALAESFIEAGVVIDEGRTYIGRAEIVRWREEHATQYTYTSEVTAAQPVGATGYHLVEHLEGNFPGGVVDLHYQFTLSGDLIYSLTIAP